MLVTGAEDGLVAGPGDGLVFGVPLRVATRTSMTSKITSAKISRYSTMETVEVEPVSVDWTFEFRLLSELRTCDWLLDRDPLMEVNPEDIAPPTDVWREVKVASTLESSLRTPAKDTWPTPSAALALEPLASSTSTE